MCCKTQHRIKQNGARKVVIIGELTSETDGLRIHIAIDFFSNHSGTFLLDSVVNKYNDESYFRKDPRVLFEIERILC